MFKWFWRGIWNLSEFTGIGLGRFAPFVFGKMIGRKGKLIKGLTTHAQDADEPRL